MNVIETFRGIERTGVLPPGFRWQSLRWDPKHGWMGWVVGPNGCNDWIKCRKIPDDLLIGVHTCPRLIGYLDLRDKYPEGGDDDL